MPALTRWLLRTALVYLLLSFVLGVAVVLPGGSGSLYPPLIHMLTVGWITQTIFGVAWWMFPRPGPGRSHGPVGVAWAGYALLNVGLLLRLWFEPRALTGAELPGLMLAVSGVVQLLAVSVFVPILWRRVSGSQSAAR